MRTTDTSIKSQLAKFKSIFPEIPFSGLENSRRRFANVHDNEIEHVLILPPALLSTKAIFAEIDLGRKNDNTWFLDITKIHDIGDEAPSHDNMYFLELIDVTNTSLSPAMTSGVENDQYPLTLHECVTLLFQFPELLTENILGVQAYGSRFGATDDTLELYKKGNAGNAFLKLAREAVQYEEDTKLIPTAVSRHYFLY